MSKRRIIVILVILGIVVLVAGGIWWWWYRNTGERLLGRASHALQHGNYPKALRLAERYIKQEPREWEGHWIKGTAQSRLKRYAEARETLHEAIKIDASQMIVVRELARTFAEPALAKLQEQLKRRMVDAERGTRLEFKKDVGVLQEVANDLYRANEALDLGTPKDAKSRLDLIETKGKNLEQIAETYRLLAREHDRAASGEHPGVTEDARAEQRKLGEAATKSADRAAAEAKAVLLEVVRQAPAVAAQRNPCTVWPSRPMTERSWPRCAGSSWP